MTTGILTLITRNDTDASASAKGTATNEMRHDAAYVELPGGKKFIIVILTRGAADDLTLLPSIGRHLIGEM